METNALDRFYRALTAILDRERPDAYQNHVTVAELYQDVVPYARMRETLGIEMHADYEHMLLLLLAGHHERVRIEPESVREELDAEAAAAEPNLSAYRRFAACEVVIMPDSRAGAAPATPAPPAAPAVPVVPAAPPADSFAPPDADLFASSDVGPFAPEEPRTGRASNDLPATPAPDSSASACPFCSERLPEHVDVRYCPYCGGDQRQRPCPACGQPLESGWRFCIACGSGVDA